MDKTASAAMEPVRAPNSSVSRPPAFSAPWSFDSAARLPLRLYNALFRALVTQHVRPSGSKELSDIRRLAVWPTDINEHLELMFTEALLCRPNLIVELGVRGGASTFVFERAAALCSADLISVDLDDCSAVSRYPRWHFFRGDDVQFAAGFSDFCRTRNLVPSIDLLFIDTSHYYDHTVQEIQAWLPHLSPRAKLMFHDTNMGPLGRRKDGCFQLSWNNQRGVIRAIEEHLGIRVNETKKCVEQADGWLIRHTPYCNGFTILDRLTS